MKKDLRRGSLARSAINFASVLLVLGSVNYLAGAESATVPELRAGDVLLCEPYPYRTVANTARTVYQMARLGFSSVRSFQHAHALKADGVIGPLTQQRADAEFVRRFGQPSAGGSRTASLSLSVQLVATVTGFTATVSIRIVAAEPPRIVGSLTHDEAHGFRFIGPTVTLHTKTCLRRGGLVSCGGRSVSVSLSQADAPAGSASLPVLRAGESGTLYASVTYLGADLEERVAESDALLPTARQK